MKPILFEIGMIQIFSYPLMMGIAWGLGWHLCQTESERLNISSKLFNGLFWGVFGFSWIGSKVFFLINSALGHATEIASHSSFWLGGGFVFYGGLIFGLIYWLIYSLVLKKFPFEESYRFAPALCFAHAIGRVGCFLTGCCYGTKCDLPWKVMLHGEWRHPVQLYESFGLLVLGIILKSKLKRSLNNGLDVIFVYLSGYAILRFILEFFRGDKIRGIYALGLSTSQIVSIIFIIISLFIYIKIKKSKNV